MQNASSRVYIYLLDLLNKTYLVLIIFNAYLKKVLTKTNKIFDIQFKILPTSFRSKVYQEMQKISYGKSVTYSELAEKIGNPKAFRAVGTACGKNPLPIIIPCHRVKAKSGLGGFTGGLEIKRFLLNLESN